LMGLTMPVAPAYAGVAPLRFALITPRDGENVVSAWTPLLKRMGEQLGVSIVPEAISDTKALIAGFAAGQVDLAWAGNAAALAVVEDGHGEVFAQMKMTDGRLAYRSVLLTHRDSALKSIEDVYREAGKLTYGDGEPNSTSGHLVPLYYAFVRQGVAEPHRLFKDIRVGKHRDNLLRAARREVDLAATNDVELELLRRENTAAAGSLRVLWHSPPIPQSPLLWRTALPRAVRQSIQQTVLRLGQDSPGEREALRLANELGGFVPSNNRQLITAADLEMFLQWRQVDNDTKMNRAERQARYASAEHTLTVAVRGMVQIPSP